MRNDHKLILSQAREKAIELFEQMPDTFIVPIQTEWHTYRVRFEKLYGAIPGKAVGVACLGFDSLHDDFVFDPVVLEKATYMTWFERFCLFFIRQRYWPFPNGTVMTVKVFRGKTYILDHSTRPPQHHQCRCTVQALS